MNMEFVSQVTW